MKTSALTAFSARAKLIAGLLLALPARPVSAAAVNTCASGGRGDYCLSNSQCSGGSLATVCVSQACQIPCVDAAGQAAPHLCSLGETCSPADTASGRVYYCKPTSFTVDLNLLDMCIGSFVDGITPELGTTNACSLQANLNSLLDQDGNGQFDIFDVDGCIRAFFDLPACDVPTKACSQGRTYCGADADCGAGLYCDTTAHACQRECGFIGNREPNGVQYLERPCYGSLQTCNYDRGRCEPVQVAALTCQADRDCPEGAYCFVGRCAPTCSRSLDCPDSAWFCTTGGRCTPRPLPTTSTQPFVPRDYVVQFAQKNVLLSALAEQQSVPLLIMNLQSKKQVFDRPDVVFGYRLEVTYSTKQAPRCMKPKAQWTPADIADCIVDDTEEFVTLTNPFGTVYATGTPAMGIRLNKTAADRLTPGLYQATITATYDNGGQDSTTVVFHKTTLTGDYTGQLSVYVDGPQNLLGTTNLSLRLSIDTAAPQVTWNDLLVANNVSADSELVDVTSGYPVGGVLHANESSIFVNPAASRLDQDEIPLIGLYSPALRRLRVLAVIEVAPDDCHSDTGTCATAGAEAVAVGNVFNRRIRRVLQLIGPYDDTARGWSGVYRETLTGLAPYSITLDGGFIVNQTRDDDSGLPIANGLLPAGAPLLAANTVVGFPTQVALLAAVTASAASACTGYTSEATKFDTKTAFDAYLAGLDAPAARAGRILPDLVSFEAALGQKVDALGGSGSSTALTLYEYLQGQIFLCSEKPGDATCIDEKKTLCGLSLYRKALLGEYVDLSALVETSMGHDLFCSPTSPSPDCLTPASQQPALAALQEHNRFHAELVHALKYQASSDLSDAFFELYKLQGTTGIDQAIARKSKLTKLLAAWKRYDQLRSDMFSPAVTSILFTWPMGYFAERGRPWLQQTHSILDDRLEALSELVDLKRRIFMTTTSQDFVFVKHLLHYEYLSEVLLLSLQRQWEGAEFAYAGEAQALLERGDLLLSKVNDTRNPLGFHPGQIFFENSNLQVVNWKNYRDQIGTRTVGLLAEVNTAIDVAVGDLKGSLADKTTLEVSFSNAQKEFDTAINNLCGSATPPATESACPILTEEQRQAEANCSGPSCVYQYACEGDECATVAQRFNQASGDPLKEVACRVDTPPYAVQVSIDPTAPMRPCVRGQMGALLQEGVQLELQRKQVFAKVRNLFRQIDAQSRLIAEMQSDNASLKTYLTDQDVELAGIQSDLVDADLEYQTLATMVDVADCIFVAGTAAGGNCIGKAIAATAKVGLAVRRSDTTSALQETRDHLLRMKEIKLNGIQEQAALRTQRMARDNMLTEVENLIAEYQAITQQLFNLQVRRSDTFFLAKEAARNYREGLNDIVAALVGNEHGSILRRNQKVQRANEKFAELLRVTYKMTMAFIHSYNLASSAGALTNQVFQITTPSGVEDLLASLDSYERNYCGLAGGIDCDSGNNTAYFRFSFRDQLFPSLRDIVDSRTGAVLTKGQQFHNLITSSMYRHTRYRAGMAVDQIELPFAIWLNDRGTQSGAVQRWMLSPLECNHVIVGRNGGTAAVNVLGSRLTGDVVYELWRGNTDFLRTCEAQQVVPAGGGTPVPQYPINSYIIGYAPQSALAQQNEPPIFISHSSGMPACKGIAENSQGYLDRESCYQYFGRDRSLAAPDWSLVIPITGGSNNAWVLGDGLAESSKPIIEDIVLYVRYRQRPVAQ